MATLNKEVQILVAWSCEVLSKNGQDSWSRDTEVGKKIAATNPHISQIIRGIRLLTFLIA